MISTNDKGLCQEKDCAGTCQDSARSLKNRNLAMAMVSEPIVCLWIVPTIDRAEALHNLQAIDFNEEKDCAVCAPLRGVELPAKYRKARPLSRESGGRTNALLWHERG